MTAPIPSAVRLHGPRDLRSRFSGSSEAAISASILCVRSSDGLLGRDREGAVSAIRRPSGQSALPLALRHVPDLLLLRSARYTRGTFGLRSRLLARGAFQL